MTSPEAYSARVNPEAAAKGKTVAKIAANLMFVNQSTD